MPRYRVLQQSFVDAKVVFEGEEIEYDGLPAENLEPLDDAGRAKYQEYLDSNAARVAKMIEQNRESPTGGIADSAKFFQALQETREQDRADMATMISKGIADALSVAFPNGMQKPGRSA